MPAAKTMHLPSLAQVLLSGVALLLFLSAAAGMFTAGLLAITVGRFSGGDVIPFFSLGWSATTIGVLLLPSLVYPLYRLMGHPRPDWLALDHARLANRAMLLWLPLLLLGELISRDQAINWLVLPPIQVLVIGIPIWWFIEVGRRGLPGNRLQRDWGMLGIALVVIPVIVLLVEILIIGSLALLLFAWAATQPELMETLNRVSQRLVNAQFDPEITLRILRPYLRHPAVIYLITAVTAGIVPLIEELLKPIALWGIDKRRLTPQEGFVLGLLCGGAFAFIESQGMLSAPMSDAWAFTVIGRTGTGLLHTITAGLVGWGLVSAWRGEKYIRLGLIFFIAAGIHGIWNLFGVLMGLLPLAHPSEGMIVFDRLSATAAPALATLSVALFILLIGSNKRLRQQPEAVYAASGEGELIPINGGNQP